MAPIIYLIYCYFARITTNVLIVVEFGLTPTVEWYEALSTIHRLIKESYSYTSSMISIYSMRNGMPNISGISSAKLICTKSN